MSNEEKKPLSEVLWSIADRQGFTVDPKKTWTQPSGSWETGPFVYFQSDEMQEVPADYYLVVEDPDRNGKGEVLGGYFGPDAREYANSDIQIQHERHDEVMHLVPVFRHAQPIPVRLTRALTIELLALRQAVLECPHEAEREEIGEAKTWIASRVKQLMGPLGTQKFFDLDMCTLMVGDKLPDAVAARVAVSWFYSYENVKQIWKQCIQELRASDQWNRVREHSKVVPPPVYGNPDVGMTKVSDGCLRCGSIGNRPAFIVERGFWKCPNCNGSYGPVDAPDSDIAYARRHEIKPSYERVGYAQGWNDALDYLSKRRWDREHGGTQS